MPLYKAGDVISSSLPFVYVVESDCKEKICDTCLKTSDNLKRCAQCLSMYYCSRDCQRHDWKDVHKFECKYAAKIMSNRASNLFKGEHGRLLFRFCIKSTLDEKSRNKKWKLFDGSERSIDDLMSHDLHLESVMRKHKELESYSYLAKILESLDIGLDYKTVLHRSSQLGTNEFSIQDSCSFLTETPKILATALFVENSIFDHSCEPNALYSFHSIRMNVRALRDIDTSKEKVLIPYVNIFETVEERKKALMLRYNFDCHCRACVQKIGGEMERITKLHHAFTEEVNLEGDIEKMIDTVLEIGNIHKTRIATHESYVELLHLLMCEIGHYMNTNGIKRPKDRHIEVFKEFRHHVKLLYGYNDSFWQAWLLNTGAVFFNDIQ